MSGRATARDETPVFFAGDDADLFGVLTRPTSSPNGVAVVFACGGMGPTSGRNAIRTNLARALAGDGFHVLRFDFRGIGESSGEPHPVDFGEPDTGDLRAAVDWLRGEGFDRVVLVGNCFGARKALAAVDAVPGLAGIALLGAPTRDTQHAEAQAGNAITAAAAKPASTYVRKALRPASLKRLADPKVRRKALRVVRAKLGRARPNRSTPQDDVSPRFLLPMASVLDRRVPVLFLYGRDDDFYPDFQRAAGGTLGNVLARGADLVTVRVMDDRVVGFRTLEAQDEMVDVVSRWLGDVAHAHAERTA